ncbi:MAG: hypothetical protein RhofKO_10560 [Rhodothermales bacterium]
MSDYDFTRALMRHMPGVPDDLDGQADYTLRLWEALQWIYGDCARVLGCSLAEAFDFAGDAPELKVKLLFVLIPQASVYVVFYLCRC